MRVWIGRLSFVVAALVFIPAAARGQAWTPPAGAGTFSLSAQTLHVDAHAIRTGELVHNIDVRAYSMTASADYGVTDRVALSVSLPYLAARYRGPAPHAGSFVDDGGFHGSISDLDLELRYKAVDGNVVVTPFLGGQWPARHYHTTGHAAPGRGLTEYSAGFDLGHQANWLSPSLFIGLGYAYSVVERVHDDIPVNRSNTDVRISYYATRRIALHVANMWQHTHGGLDFPLSADDQAHHAHHHDQMIRADSWRGSAGASYSIRPNVDVYVAWATSIRSQNSHSFRTVTVGTGWSFEGRPSLPYLRSVVARAAR